MEQPPRRASRRPASRRPPPATRASESRTPAASSWSNRSPGQQNVHPVALERLDATASGTTVSVDAYWTSGVDPCYVLDQVQVDENDNDQTVDVTVIEGTSDPDAICVMMAVAKHTIFSFEVPAAGHVDDPRLAGWCAAGRGRGLVVGYAPSVSGRPQGACATIRR